MKHLLALFFAIASLSAPVSAEVTPWAEIPEGKIRLLSSGGQGGDPIALGIEVDLNEGWKIYWRYAGPVGLPSRFTFESDQAGNVFYPWPKRAELQGFPSYGYEGRMVFPGIAYATGALRVDLAICSATQCIPFRTSFDVEPAAPDTLVEQKLRRAMDTVPVLHSNFNLGNMPISVSAVDGRLILSGTLNNPTDFLIDPPQGGPNPLGDGNLPNAAQSGFFVKQPEGHEAFFAVKDDVDIEGILALSTLYFRDDDGYRVLIDHGLDRPGSPVFGQTDLSAILGLVSPTVEASPDTQEALFGTLYSEQVQSTALGDFFSAAVLMLIGGLLLNIMPCVFPILFLKLKTALSGQADLRRSFAWTAVGMVGTFTLLGIALAAVQGLTGVQLALGAWMQFPLTTLILAALLILFIANALDWFEFKLPGSIANATGQGVGAQGVLGDVIAGAVAALLGGACAGALLAFALAYAFTAGGVTMVVLLTIMGIGLALPYLLVALIPQAARYLPKPGPWLAWIKPIMAAGLALTFAYLVFIATRQIALPALLLMVGLAGVALFLFSRNLKIWAFTSLAILAFALPFWTLPPNVEERERNYHEEISALVEDGELVLVDVTAYWCATCQTNKLLVLDTAEVQEMLENASARVFTINADVYHPNVNDYLNQVGRSALPLNILYSPRHPKGVILPSVLSKAAVREALDGAID